MTISIESLVIFALVGVIAGFLASQILGGRGGLARYLILGVIGAIVGGVLANVIGLGVLVSAGLIDQIIIATGGALVVSLVARVIA